MSFLFAPSICYIKIVRIEIFSILSNPKIPSSTLESRVEGRKVVKVSRIAQKMIKQDIEGDWVAVGVCVHKFPQKTSSNGKTFCVWQLTDLGCGNENEIVSFFLFGKVYQEHWKIPVGQVVALLNPTIMDQKNVRVKVFDKMFYRLQ